MSNPYQKHSATSKAAADSVDSSAQRAQVYAFIKKRKDKGATGDEVAAYLDIPIGTASARFSQLMDERLIVKTETTRETRSGRQAVVHVTVQ